MVLITYSFSVDIFSQTGPGSGSIDVQFLTTGLGVWLSNNELVNSKPNQILK
jgi:hypothetical protein